MPKETGKTILPQKKERNLSINNLDKIIPKYCNSINFSKINDNVMMTLVFSEPGVEEQHTVIDRILIDKEHVKKMIKILSKVSK